METISKQYKRSWTWMRKCASGRFCLIASKRSEAEASQSCITGAEKINSVKPEFIINSGKIFIIFYHLGEGPNWPMLLMCSVSTLAESTLTQELGFSSAKISFSSDFVDNGCSLIVEGGRGSDKLVENNHRSWRRVQCVWLGSLRHIM